MSQQLIVRKTLEIEAITSVVWEALTNSEKLKKTMFGCEVITNWKIGSQILFKGSWEGNEFIDKGTILDYQNGKTYKYDYWSNFSGLPDKAENYSTIKFEIESDESNNRTILKLEQSNFATDTMYEHSDKNWDIALKSLKELIEQE